MSIKLYEGDFDDLTGGILASWFIFNPNGPTAFAAGFVETTDAPWSLFYRRMHFNGGKTYLGAVLDDEISAASGNFGEVFFNLMIGVNIHIALNGCDEQLFSGGVPTFVRTNGNPDVDAAMRELIAVSTSLHEVDWGRELFLRETYGTDLFGSAGEQVREAYEKHKKQAAHGSLFLQEFWAQHQHIPSFRNWTPGRYQSRPFSKALFARWWAAVTEENFVAASTVRFAQAWLGAVHNVSPDMLSGLDGYTSYSEVVRFFDNFHMPLLPSFIDEQYLLASLGLLRPEA